MRVVFHLCTIIFLLLFTSGTNSSTPGFPNQDETIDDDYQETILVSTIDGRLRALDAATGEIKWTLQEEPVLRSPSAVKQGFTFLPNPLDGSLYVLKNSSLKKLPFSIPQLVHASPCRGNDGIMYAGSKKDVWFGIDPKTGLKMETLSSASADRICPASQKQTIFLGRTEYRVSMFDEKNRGKTWNATFNDYSAHLLPAVNTWPYKHYASSSHGYILTFDKDTGEMKWEADLKQPVVALYLLRGDGLHKLPFEVMGKETMENVAKNIFTVDQWPTVLGVNAADPHTTSITNQFFPALFVGESPFGLYAIEALVDHQTITYSPKLLGPPLLEGPAPIALTDLEREEYLPPRRPIIQNIPPSITHKTSDGEYLLLGYHDRPTMVMATIIPSRFPFPVHRNAIESPDPPPQITGPVEPKQHEDTSIILLLLERYPLPFYGTLVTIIVLILTVIWQCGRQWDQNSTGSRMESFEIVNTPGETRSVQTSKQLNRGSFGWNKKIEIPEGWMAVGSKLMYHPSDILGTGCEGTVVYRGTFDGREVAVKRVVSEFVKFAHREADLLRESDTHPHVIRYFCMESDSQFKYLALELCIASLNDYVERKELQENVPLSINDILRQATDGLAHLHASKIVHRDMKPQNVLITMASQRGEMRAVISDFGLCKRIQPGKNSISRGIASGMAGTDGWIAPEVLISASTSYPVDIFSLGCIFYYVLTGGTHPFGKSLHRQANIVNGQFTLNKLADLNDWSLAEDLITSMLQVEPLLRLSADAVLSHPFFWTSEKRLAYFSDVSDRVEKEEDNSPVVRRIETDARTIVCGGWRTKICEALQEDLRKFRTYKTFSVRDLLRAMRNKKHHYRELPEEVRSSLGDIPDRFLFYFTSRFPRLLLHVYKATEYCANEAVFRRYYSDDVRVRMLPIVTEEERIRKEIREQMSNEVWARAPSKTDTNEQRPPLKSDNKRNNNKKKVKTDQ